MPDKIKRIGKNEDIQYSNEQKTKLKLGNYEFGNVLRRSCIGHRIFKGRFSVNHLTVNNDEMIKYEFQDFFKHISDLYQSFVPDIFDCDKYYMGTCFNQIQINSSVRSANHYDRGNIGMSAMIKWSSSTRKLKKTTEDSKNILFSDYNLSIGLDETDILFFQSDKVAHSNPQIQLIDGSIHDYHDNTNIMSLVFFKSKSLLKK